MMNNVVELRKELSNIFASLKSGSLDVKSAKEMNNSAGKIIGTVKVELEYAALRKEIPSIEFMKNPESKD